MATYPPIERVKIVFAPDCVVKGMFPSSRSSGKSEYTYRELGEVLQRMLFYGETHHRLVAADLVAMFLPYSVVDVDTEKEVKITLRPHTNKVTYVNRDSFVDWFADLVMELAKGAFALPTEITIR